MTLTEPTAPTNLSPTTDAMSGTDVVTTNGQRAERKLAVAIAGRQTDLDTAYRLAGNLAASNLLPQDLRGKPSDVLVILLYGQELGLAPMQAIQTIDVMKGRPSLRANLWVALARKAGHKVRVVEETATSCTVKVTRHDDPEPHIVTYTLEDAKTAGLLSNSNYAKNPKAMLYARAASTCCRRACPEVAMGFSDEYELHASEPAARPTLAQVAAERTDQPAAPVVEVDDEDMRQQVAALAAEHSDALDAEVVDDTAGLWPEVTQPGGQR